MRKLLLTSSVFMLLGTGAAFAGNHGGDPGGKSAGTTTTTVVTAIPIKNATSAGTGNSSATTGGTAVSASLSNSANTSNSDNTANSNNSSTSAFKSLDNVGNSYLSITRTNTHVNVRLATSSNNGEVGGTLYINDPTCGCDRDSKSSTGALTGNASMSEVNGGNGINTAEQNTGVNSLQQNSVALSSVVGSGTGFSGF